MVSTKMDSRMDWATNRNDSLHPFPLLTTKLQVVRARPNLLVRSRLLECIDEGLHGKLIIISAPAGFGKTSLLSSWAKRSKQNVAWLSLDHSDDTPRRFWAYVVGALQSVQPSLGVSALGLLNSKEFQLEAILTSLINDLSSLPQEMSLILDDYHYINDPAIHSALCLFIERMPSHFHIAIAGRTMPPLRLTRLRAYGEVAEINGSDLRFTPSEAAELVEGSRNSRVGMEAINDIVHRTEGWAVGLQLALQSVQNGRPGGAIFGPASPLEHLVNEYLTNEVLGDNNNCRRDFLLKSSILDRFNADVCRVVTGREDSEPMLDELVRHNMFITVSDDQRWYRYHPMFAGVLRSHLKREHPEEIARLHTLASAWFEEREMAAEAVDHLLQAGELDHGIRLAEQHAESLLAKRQLTTLLSWAALFPENQVEARPRLAMAFAWTYLLSEKFEVAEKYLDTCRRFVERESENGLADIASHVSTAESFLSGLHRGNGRQQLSFATAPTWDVLENAGMSSANRNMRGSDSLPKSDPPRSDRPATLPSIDDRFGIVQALPELARLQLAMGQLRTSAATYRQALQLLERTQNESESTQTAAMAHIGLGEIHFEWNDLDSTMLNLGNGLRLSKQKGDLLTMREGYLLLTRVHQARGDVDGAMDSIDEAERTLRSHGATDDFLSPLTCQRARIWLAQGKLQHAGQWLLEHSLELPADPTTTDVDEALTKAKILISEYRSDDALEFLSGLIQIAETHGRNDTLIRSLLLQALALDQQGDVDLSTTALMRALNLSEAEGYIRVYLYEGAPMARLLRRVRESENPATGYGTVSTEYLDTLLGALGSTPADESEPEARNESVGYGSKPVANAMLLSPLSEREIEVLQLIAGGKSNAAIADSLYISLSTVKTHINNLYSKLGVESRTQALVRAREINLL